MRSTARPESIVGSALFNVYFYAWTFAVCVGALPAYPFLDDRGMRVVARVWSKGLLWGLRVLAGVDHEVRGLERLPAEPAIIASKHQSAWETFAYFSMIRDLSIGLKYELTLIPVFGWYLMRSGAIRIDRGAGSQALRSLVKGAREVSARGCSILIFPEGTRRAPDDPPDYKPGVAALYTAVGMPVVPVALTSGLFWRRRSFVKRPGRIVVEFLEPIPPGLPRKVFMAELEGRIEAATARLTVEAGRAGELRPEIPGQAA